MQEGETMTPRTHLLSTLGATYDDCFANQFERGVAGSISTDDPSLEHRLRHGH